MRRIGLALLALGLLVGSAGWAVEKPGAPKAEAVTIESGGWKLAAAYTPSQLSRGDAPSPAVILVHMLARNKETWDPLVPRLTGAGYAVLAFDLRGHGGSVRADGKQQTYQDFQPEDWAAAAGDVLAVRDWLVKNKAEVDAARIAVVGASIGANYALLAAAGDEKLRGAVLLSPGLDYHGVKTEAAAGKLRPGQLAALFAAGGDQYSAETVAKLAQALPKGALAAEKVYAGAEHGTLMLGKAPGIEEEMLKALSAMLAPARPAGEKPKAGEPPRKDPAGAALEKVL
jgi:dienelactone hydrolase